VFGASWGELAFVAILFVIVLVAQIAPRIGEAMGARFAARAPGNRKPPA
jgi:Sec-independent protein translocase protein TatA